MIAAATIPVPLAPAPRQDRIPFGPAARRRRHPARSAGVFLAAVEVKDHRTAAHCRNVAHLSEAIARELGLDPKHIAKVRRAGLLHDVGKVAVAPEILLKAGRLSADEAEAMRDHARIGHEMVAAVGLAEEALWILHHHERLDGDGYPCGLRGEQVPLESRIIFVADTYDAITADRPYRRGSSRLSALAELAHHAGTQFDPDCVMALRRAVGPGRLSALAGGEPFMRSPIAA